MATSDFIFPLHSYKSIEHTYKKYRTVNNFLSVKM